MFSSLCGKRRIPWLPGAESVNLLGAVVETGYLSPGPNTQVICSICSLWCVRSFKREAFFDLLWSRGGACHIPLTPNTSDSLARVAQIWTNEDDILDKRKQWTYEDRSCFCFALKRPVLYWCAAERCFRVGMYIVWYRLSRRRLVPRFKSKSTVERPWSRKGRFA